MLMFLFVNGIMLIGWDFFVSRRNIYSPSLKFVLIGLFYFSQIILSQLFLGLLGLLFTGWVIGVNLALSGSLIFLSIRGGSPWKALQTDYIALKTFFKTLAWENVILLTFSVIAGLWILTAVCFLPPRGVDDLTYHLPRIYEYWIRHKIVLLPTKFLPFFAFPENAEMIFLWPIVFFKNQQWVEGGQLVFGVYGTVCLYALGRFLKFPARLSFFIALLFFLNPIVLNQMGTNYIEVITSVAYLVAVLCALNLRREKNIFFLYSTALAIGMAVGMKFTLLMLMVPLSFLIIPHLKKFPLRHIAGAVSVIILSGGFWYFRNFIMLHDPFYPMSVLAPGMKTVHSANLSWALSLLNFITALAQKFYLLVCKDLWLATFNAGFGAVFWGLAFPAWIVASVRVFQKCIKKKFTKLFLWIHIPLGFLVLIPRPVGDLMNDVRYALFMIPFGLIFLGETFIIWFRRPILARAMKSLCVFLSFLSLTTVAGSFHPGYRIDVPLKDFRQGAMTSEFKYLEYGGWIKPLLRWVAEPLDYITRGENQGLNCYVATDISLGIINAYGTRLQNRVWNLLPADDPARPDAYVLMDVFGQKILYYRQKFTLEDAIRDPSLVMISMTKNTWLLAREDILKKEGRVDSLLRYYQMTFPNEIQIGEQVTKNISKDVPLIDTSILGFGLRYLQLKGWISNPFYWIPDRDLEEFIKEHDWPTAYSIRKPLRGYESRPFKIVVFQNKKIILWENIRPHENRPK